MIAKFILKIFSVCPHKLSGIRIELPHFEYRQALVSSLKSILPNELNILSIPAGIASEHLTGGLDFLGSLREGVKVYREGLLSRNKKNGQVFLLSLTRDIDRAVSNLLCADLDKTLEKTNENNCDFNSLIVFEELPFNREGENQNVPHAINERLALTILGTELTEDYNLDNLAMSEEEIHNVDNARKIFSDVTLSEDQLSMLVAISSELAVEGFRQVFFAITVSKVIAALQGRTQVGDEDIKLAASLVFLSKAKSIPSHEDENQLSIEDEDNDAPTEKNLTEESNQIDSSDSSIIDSQDGEGQSIENERVEDNPANLDSSIQNTTLSKEFLQSILASELSKRLKGSSSFGRGQTFIRNTSSGKNYSSMRWQPGLPHKIKIVDSIQAALPYQVERQTYKNFDENMLLRILPEDLRVSKKRNRVRNTTIFLVDASGSSASKRLGEAKGAVELLLAECYIRRDEVALISFRGKRSDLLLEPTRSLVRAKKCLRGLKGGGGTPMAAALEHAFNLCWSELSHGKIPVLVILSDGGANVTKSGIGGRGKAFEESLKSAELFNSQTIKSIFIDIADNPVPQTRFLANKIGSTYLPLPRASSKKILDAVTTIR
ncbi:VWA domain-containing protein [Betaproteobacteria bacterium]|nr:VWA domain-containing protein [Betaproteobacteria bacterium]